ncbi:MAG: NUDIX domain-containing protein [Thermoplasmata archaeon]|nr:NUDIX domain-containing protein [Thermoplasmata archaeon]
MARGSLPFRADRPAVVELAAGAVVVDSRAHRFLLLHEPTEDRWCFPKGHVEAGESLLGAAKREVAEETGLENLDFRGELGEVTYRFYNPRRDRNVLKTSVYFLALAENGRLKLESTFDEARWEPAAVAASLLRFETDRRMLAAAVNQLDHSTPR